MTASLPLGAAPLVRFAGEDDGLVVRDSPNQQLGS
jgi:hypothetical protein